MKIAVVSAEGRGETDRLISEAVAVLQVENLRLAGISKIQQPDIPGQHHCDMVVQVLPDGPDIRITQSLGKEAQGCRLDPTALTSAVAEVEARADLETDLFVLNKFGPEEAAGRGFCAAIGGALERNVPVLVGVGRASRDDFDTFAGGLAELVPANSEAILNWCRTACLKAS
ncbi:DUF2478 domain-containing protein [Parasedimentitalea maritima]|uniref:DUF2478 domain-containing protein n=1 Tax=Parasedimentitalea maritima TaxID=2578117 RepID=A0A6A4R6Q8_9RHOB|nr:DUF2478 domain-containing protein [Zongyanglinia marina]KAE9625065.1 DUF2478 domain-containing protein [Zongyanglinia marina]